MPADEPEEQMAPFGDGHQRADIYEQSLSDWIDIIDALREKQPNSVIREFPACSQAMQRSHPSVYFQLQCYHIAKTHTFKKSHHQ